MKKFISLALVLAMAFCFSVTALASGSPGVADGGFVDKAGNDIHVTETASSEEVREAAIATVEELINDDSGSDSNNNVYVNNALDAAGIMNEDGSLNPYTTSVLYSADLSGVAESAFPVFISFTGLDAYNGSGWVVLHKGEIVDWGVIEDGVVANVELESFSPVTLIAMTPVRAAAAASSSSSTSTTSSAKVCPVCGKTNVSLVNGKYLCNDCGHNWAEVGMAAYAAGTAGGPTSPKTGDAGVAAALVVAVMAGAGVCAFARKDEAC